MGNDRPDDADVPSGERSDQSADRTDATHNNGEHSARSGGTRAEIRSREEYYSDLRAGTSVEERAETLEEFRGMRGNFERMWPADQHTPVNRSNDPPGYWRSDSNWFLNRTTNDRVEKECDHIAETERDKLSPCMRSVENSDPDRYLIGFEHRLKSRDRIKEKVAEQMASQPELSADEALATVKDKIRFTFCYTEERYTNGVEADLARLEERGFDQVERRNSWSSDQYKGINSWWREPATGLLFEMQFHTLISFEAKQLTHAAYERLRDPRTSPAEQRELEDFQRDVCAKIPIPPGATEIPDYP
jgi:hypothetical protein